MMDDTSPEASQRYYELLRAQSPVQRLAIAARLSRAVRELAMAGIRAQHPLATAADVQAHLRQRLYSAEVDRPLPVAKDAR